MPLSLSPRREGREGREGGRAARQKSPLPRKRRSARPLGRKLTLLALATYTNTYARLLRAITPPQPYAEGGVWASYQSGKTLINILTPAARKFYDIESLVDPDVRDEKGEALRSEIVEETLAANPRYYE